MIESKSGKTSVLNTFCVCLCVEGEDWGLDKGWMPLPTCPQRYCDPASLVLITLTMSVSKCDASLERLRSKLELFLRNEWEEVTIDEGALMEEVSLNYKSILQSWLILWKITQKSWIWLTLIYSYEATAARKRNELINEMFLTNTWGESKSSKNSINLVWISISNK